MNYKLENEDNNSGVVDTIYNHLYFYSALNTDKAAQLIKSAKELESNLKTEQTIRGLKENIPIWIHINSVGGDLYSAFAVADCLQSLSVPVYSIVEGLGASAATVVSVACTKRYIQKHAYMLIHQFSSWFSGTHEDFKDELLLQEMLMETLVDYYSSHITMTKEDLQEKLKHNFWMNAEQAVEYGFVDEIL